MSLTARAESIAWSTIRSMLHDAIGPDEAVTLARLADSAGISRRDAEVLIETRLLDLGFAIVSGSAGLYRPLSADDINRYRASLRSRIRCLAIRSRAVRRLALGEGYRPAGPRLADPVADPPPREQPPQSAGFLFDLPPPRPPRAH